MADINIIRSRWEHGAKIAGLSNVITLADGGIILGCYFLTECGTVTPSHDPLSGFAKSEGYPTDGKRSSQRVQNICDNTVCFEWIDGGVIYVNTATVIKDWKPSNYGICVFEAA